MGARTDLMAAIRCMVTMLKLGKVNVMQLDPAFAGRIRTAAGTSMAAAASTVQQGVPTLLRSMPALPGAAGRAEWEELWQALASLLDPVLEAPDAIVEVLRPYASAELFLRRCVDACIDIQEVCAPDADIKVNADMVIQLASGIGTLPGGSYVSCTYERLIGTFLRSQISRHQCNTPAIHGAKSLREWPGGLAIYLTKLSEGNIELQTFIVRHAEFQATLAAFFVEIETVSLPSVESMTALTAAPWGESLSDGLDLEKLSELHDTWGSNVSAVTMHAKTLKAAAGAIASARDLMGATGLWVELGDKATEAILRAKAFSCEVTLAELLVAIASAGGDSEAEAEVAAGMRKAIQLAAECSLSASGRLLSMAVAAIPGVGCAAVA
jgi:hypothetical protein